METKTCARCKEAKEHCHFSKVIRKSGNVHLHAYCTTCKAIAYKEWAAANIGRRLALNANYHKANPTKKKNRLMQFMKLEKLDALLIFCGLT